MKTTLIVTLSLLTAALSVQAQAPSRKARTRALTQNGNFVAPRNPGAGAAITPQTTTTDGVIPRAARSGNPLQMLNPFAPAEYGSGREVVRHEDGDPYQNPRGVKLVTVEF